MTRRDCLSIASVALWSALRPSPLRAAQDDLERRMGRVIREYAQQGFHRTGTAVDRRSGDWLCEEIRRVGVEPARESFALSRIDPANAALVVGPRRIEGLPLFDGTFTGAAGIRGRLGPLNSDAEIGLAEAAPNTAAAGPLGEARRERSHQALVCVTRGGRPGLCPSNADAFLRPFGPPLLQVSSEHSMFLREQAERRAEVHLIAVVERVDATPFNVTAKIDGKTRALPPLIVMTPRSGWYACASERGGGIACWLEIMRMLRTAKPERDVLFVASSGHELGHLGIDAFIDRRPGLVSKAIGWMHLGANIGAATRPGVTVPADTDPARRHATAAAGAGNTIQASDAELEAVLSRAMASENLGIARRTPRGTVPGGEAEAVHRGGGRYVSVIGSNALFHNPEDRGLAAVDLSVIARFTRALSAVVKELSR